MSIYIIIIIIIIIIFDRVSDSFSLNAAMFAAVCLASRLPSSFHTFVIMVFAVILFAIVPKLRNELKVIIVLTTNIVT